MGIFSWFTDLFSSNIESSSIADDNFLGGGSDSIGTSSLDDFAVNPANGFPMVGGAGGVDIEGNPYGTDFLHDQMASRAPMTVGHPAQPLVLMTVGVRAPAVVFRIGEH